MSRPWMTRAVIYAVLTAGMKANEGERGGQYSGGKWTFNGGVYGGGGLLKMLLRGSDTLLLTVVTKVNVGKSRRNANLILTGD